jgi:hypothetical protein
MITFELLYHFNDDDLKELGVRFSPERAKISLAIRRRMDGLNSHFEDWAIKLGLTVPANSAWQIMELKLRRLSRPWLSHVDSCPFTDCEWSRPLARLSALMHHVFRSRRATPLYGTVCSKNCGDYCSYPLRCDCSEVQSRLESLPEHIVTILASSFCSRLPYMRRYHCKKSGRLQIKILVDVWMLGSVLNP